MIPPDIHRAAFVAFSSVSSAGVLAVSGIPEDHATTVAVIVGAVTVVAGGIAWLDKRVEGKIKEHERKEFEKEEQVRILNAQRYEARKQFEEERHTSILREIAHVKELLDLRGEIRALKKEE